MHVKYFYEKNVQIFSPSGSCYNSKCLCASHNCKYNNCSVVLVLETFYIWMDIATQCTFVKTCRKLVLYCNLRTSATRLEYKNIVLVRSCAPLVFEPQFFVCYSRLFFVLLVLLLYCFYAK